MSSHHGIVVRLPHARNYLKHEDATTSSHHGIVVRLPPAHAYVKHEDTPRAVAKHQSQKPRAKEATTKDCRPEIIVRLPPASAYSSEDKDNHGVVVKSPLLKLPQELRDMIYRFALLSNDRVRISKSNGIPEPGLLFVNKAVRSETIPIFYQGNQFTCEVLNYDDTAIRMAIRKADCTMARHSLQIATVGGWKVAFRVTQRSWKNLVSWLHACQRRSSTGFTKHNMDSTEDKLIGALFSRFFDKPVMTMPHLDALLKAMRPVLVALHSDWARD